MAELAGGGGRGARVPVAGLGVGLEVRGAGALARRAVLARPVLVRLGARVGARRRAAQGARPAVAERRDVRRQVRLVRQQIALLLCEKTRRAINGSAAKTTNDKCSRVFPVRLEHETKNKCVYLSCCKVNDPVQHLTHARLI